MSKFFARFFNSSQDQPDIKFGRYSDSYKEDKKYDSWDLSLEKYENGQYLECFENFLLYLQDDSLGNLTYKRTEESIVFEIFQGSKKITGKADQQKFKAEAKIARTQKLDIGFLRRLIEANYRLEYTRFALDDEDCIAMVFDTFALDASPYKLYYALKELATNADKQDDILVAEFEGLQSVNTIHIREIPDSEKEVKYHFLQDSIKQVLYHIDNSKLNITHYPGAASYLILDTVYKLDFLIKPEGLVMEALEQIQEYFFKVKTKSAQEKNKFMYRELRKLESISKADFYRELYEVVSTFGLTLPSGHERLRNLIKSEIENMDWYVRNGHDTYACAIPGYIVGYCLYNYALPKPDKELLTLYYRITEEAYFNKLGIKSKFYVHGNLNKSAIIQEVKNIRNRHTKEYPRINISYKVLNFSSNCLFRKSYLEMMILMDLNKGKKRI